jgi:ketol-acid reductoisomerase
MPKGEKPYKTYVTPPLVGPKGPVERVTVIGYGNQGRAQSLNMRDSGLPVTVGLRENSPSHMLAARDGFLAVGIEEAVRSATAVFILVPDEVLHEPAGIAQKLVLDGTLLVLAHGASLHFHRWEPREGLDVGLIAPHGPGLIMRRQFVDGGGIPAILAEVQDATGRCRQRIETLAAALGCARESAGVHWSTLKEEVETDLFVEQTLLVGGLIELLRAVVATLCRAGYDPAIARMSTVREIENIGAIYDKLGPVAAFKAISPTAAFGAATRGPRLIDQHTRHVLDDILEEIRSGAFTDELVSPEAPIILRNYLANLETSHLAAADRLFHPVSPDKKDIQDA